MAEESGERKQEKNKTIEKKIKLYLGKIRFTVVCMGRQAGFDYYNSFLLFRVLITVNLLLSTIVE